MVKGRDGRQGKKHGGRDFDPLTIKGPNSHKSNHWTLSYS